MLSVSLYLCCRLGEFCGFIETIEDLQKQLQREDLTSDQYKDLQAQFQVCRCQGLEPGT